jgi:hypothetical protein
MTWAEVWAKVQASLAWPPLEMGDGPEDYIDADYENWLASLSDPEDDE